MHGRENDYPVGPIVEKPLFCIGVSIIVTAASFLGCLGSDQESDCDTIMLYGFSVKGEVLDEKIIPDFITHWKNSSGKNIQFKTMYAGSGKITNQVINGAPAEIMILSTEWDAIQLRKNGLIVTEWKSFPYNGTVSVSPWIIMTRSGNPRNIADFINLTDDGLELIHADPLTSGGACWSIFSIYGSELRKTEAGEGVQNKTAARELLMGIKKNVISWQSSARKALSQFTLGYGDAFITYENDALLSLSQGEDCELIYPESTIFSEHKVVIVDKNVKEGEKEVIEAFIDFLYTRQAQLHLVEYGFRSVDDDINNEHEEFSEIQLPFKVDFLGGWETARPEIIEGIFNEL